MKPAIKLNEPKFRSEIMAIQEQELMMECAKQIAQSLENKIKRSRNLKEISELQVHQVVVNRMIQNLDLNQHSV